jgi:hypothetical protein
MIFVKDIAPLNAALETVNSRLSLQDFRAFLKAVTDTNLDLADAPFVVHVSTEDLKQKRVVDLRVVLPLELVGAIEQVDRALRLGSKGDAEAAFTSLLGKVYGSEVTWHEDDKTFEFCATEDGAGCGYDFGYANDTLTFLGGLAMMLELYIEKERPISLIEATNDDFLYTLAHVEDFSNPPSDLMDSLPLEMKNRASDIQSALLDQDFYSAQKLRNKLIGPDWVVSGAEEGDKGLIVAKMDRKVGKTEPAAEMGAEGIPSTSFYTSMIAATLRIYARNLTVGHVAI